MHMWIIFAFFSALLESFKDVTGKTSATRTNEYTTAFAMKSMGLLVLLPVVLFVGLAPIRPQFWIAFVTAMFTMSSGVFLYMRAVRLSPLSVSIPLLSFNPVFTALLSYVFFHEVPDLPGWMGILLVSAGLYMMRLARSDLWRGLLRPVVSIKDEPGAVAMLGVAFIWSIGAYVAKALVVASSPLTAAFFLSLAGSIGLFVFGAATRRLHFADIRKHLRLFIPMGVADSLSELFIALALTTGIVPYVMPIKRTNIALSSVAGSIFFGEHLGRAKRVGMVTVLVGIFFIIAL